MPILPNGQTCLENIAMTHRPVLLKENEYQKENEYNDKHVNAIADGDSRGRGTEKNHGHSVPDSTSANYYESYGHYQSPYNYQIDTDLKSGRAGSGAGDCVDVKNRNRLLNINDYKPETNKEYDANYVKTRRGELPSTFVVTTHTTTP